MKKIVIIDDDIYIENMLEELLRCNGYDVLRTYSGTEALFLLSQNKPDLVLLDLMLPGLSGEEVLPKIQGVPVIVVSAKVDVQDKVNLLLGGAVDYIPNVVISLMVAGIVVLSGMYAYGKLSQPEFTPIVTHQSDGRYLLEDGAPNPKYLTETTRTIYYWLTVILPSGSVMLSLDKNLWLYGLASKGRYERECHTVSIPD